MRKCLVTNLGSMKVGFKKVPIKFDVFILYYFNSLKKMVIILL